MKLGQSFGVVCISIGLLFNHSVTQMILEKPGNYDDSLSWAGLFFFLGCALLLVFSGGGDKK